MKKKTRKLGRKVKRTVKRNVKRDLSVKKKIKSLKPKKLALLSYQFINPKKMEIRQMSLSKRNTRLQEKIKKLENKYSEERVSVWNDIQNIPDNAPKEKTVVKFIQQVRSLNRAKFIIYTSLSIILIALLAFTVLKLFNVI